MKRQLSTASAIALVLVLMVGAGWWIANAIDPRLDAADIAGYAGGHGAYRRPEVPG